MTQEGAIRLSKSVLPKNKIITTLVVSESGDVHANGDLDEICKQFESEKKNYFILKGEKSKKKKEE